MHRLADPTHPGVPATQWWPPRILEPGWIAAHADEFDVLHLHFGLESRSLDEVTRALDAARAKHKPIVFTIHDLQNPQLHDQEQHARMLELVVSAADELITLTASAQREVARRFGRHARLVPHPPILDPAAVRPLGRERRTRLAGVHLRDLRANIDAVAVVAALVEAVAMCDGVDAVVHLNERTRDEATARRVQEIAADRIEVRRTPRLSDGDLAASLADLDVCVLPYRHGTHSGWLELCWDLGVPVAGPRVGHFADQHPGDYTAFEVQDPSSLARAIDRASDAGARPGSPERRVLVAARQARRAVEADLIRAVHSDIYRAVLTAEVAA